MESINVFSENIDKLLNETIISKKRCTKIFNMEFNLDNVFDIENLVTLIDKYQESLSQTKKLLVRELSRKKIFVSCKNCIYVHQQEQAKESYFCLNAREFIEHDISEKIDCMGYKSR